MDMKQNDSFRNTLSEPIWPPLGFTLKEIIVHNKSLLRTMTNWVLRLLRNEVQGTVIDLASGKRPSYWQHMELEKISHQIISIDLKLSCQPTVVADISAVPLKNNICDTVIIIGSLMHVAEPLKVLQEARSILKQNGCLIFFVPFVFNIAFDPQDFWRFTPNSISWLSWQCGFNKVLTIPLGDRWSAIANLILTGTPRLNRVFAPIIVPLFICLDRISQKLLKKMGKRLPPCPIGYVVLARTV